MESKDLFLFFNKIPIDIDSFAGGVPFLYGLVIGLYLLATKAASPLLQFNVSPQKRSIKTMLEVVGVEFFNAIVTRDVTLIYYMTPKI